MNSIHLISHHLFVAAASNEARMQERSRKRQPGSDASSRARVTSAEMAAVNASQASARVLRSGGQQARA